MPTGIQTQRDYESSYNMGERNRGTLKKDTPNVATSAAQELKKTPSQNAEKAQSRADQDRRTTRTENVEHAQHIQGSPDREEEGKNKQQEQEQDKPLASK